MAIQVHCSCGHDASVSEKYAGFSIACPSCGNPLAVTKDSSTSVAESLASTKESVATSVKHSATSTKDRVTSTKESATSSDPGTSAGQVRTKCTCGKTLTVNARLAGRKANCPACGKQVTFPDGATEQGRLIVFSCKCGRKLRAPMQWAGRKTKCPTCQFSVTIPAGKSPAPSSQNDLPAAESPGDNPQPGDSERPDLSGLLDEIGAHECKKSRRCPKCKNDMERDDVLCIECGYNVRTGKLIETDDAHRKSMLEVMRGWLGEP